MTLIASTFILAGLCFVAWGLRRVAIALEVKSAAAAPPDASTMGAGGGGRR
jgi:hypothetical protein